MLYSIKFCNFWKVITLAENFLYTYIYIYNSYYRNKLYKNIFFKFKLNKILRSSSLKVRINKIIENTQINNIGSWCNHDFEFILGNYQISDIISLKICRNFNKNISKSQLKYIKIAMKKKLQLHNNFLLL